MLCNRLNDQQYIVVNGIVYYIKIFLYSTLIYIKGLMCKYICERRKYVIDINDVCCCI